MPANLLNRFGQYEPWLFMIGIKTTALLLLSMSLAQTLRKASASFRHFLHSITLTALLLIPLAAFLLPGLPIAVLPPGSNSEQSMHAIVQQSSSSVNSSANQFSEKQAITPGERNKQFRHQAGVNAAASNRQLHSRLLSDGPQRAGFSSATAPSASADSHLNPPLQAAPSALSMLVPNWRGALVLLWICGVVVCWLRLVISTLRLRALLQRAVLVDSIPITSRLRWLCRDLGIRREVIVLASDEIDVPMAAGIFDPKILLSPESATWDETRRTAVLCHELAHIKRLDALTQLLAGIATALYWFNPLVWFTVRATRLERERACDDQVLAYGTAPSEYAHELLEIVSTLRRPQPAAALAMARRSQLEGRVLALLNPDVRHSSLSRGPALALVAGIIGIALPLAATTLQERSRESDRPPLAPAVPVVQGVAPSRPADVVEPDLHGAVQGAVASAIEGGVENGIQGGVEGGVEPGVQDGIHEGVGNGFGWGSSAIGMPVYPGATALEHKDGRGTVSLIQGAHVGQLQAAAYLSQDNPQKVLQFYREHLQNYGQVIECTGGTNTSTDVQLDDAALREPSVCRSSEFAAGGTELKLNSEDRRIVVALPHNSGSEIALVRYNPGSGSDDHAWSQVKTSSPAFDCFDGISSEHTNISSNSRDGYRTWTASWSGGECSVDVHSSGTVRFNAEATAIDSITPGGFFEVNERKGDTLRRLRVDPAASGLNYTYKVNGAQQEFDSEARAWFSRFLVQLERVSGFAADARVPALLKKGGPQAVLDEISQLQTDYVRQVYFTKLFENATLSGPQLVKALDEARSEISTDYSLAQVLLTIAQRYDLQEEAQRTAFLNGATKLHTDYEHSRVLIELLKRPNLSPQIVRAALESAKTIGTDYEKSRILTTLAGLRTFDESEVNTYLGLASSIGTDYEHSRSLLALMEHQKLSSAAISQILKSASTIGTDYEKSRLLIALNGSSNFDEKQIATYLSLVDTIGTDYERSRDLIALMHDHKLANDSLARIIGETQKIGTDYEKARVLTEVAERYQVQGALRDAYIKAADSIGTEYDRNRTLAAITKREMM